MSSQYTRQAWTQAAISHFSRTVSSHSLFPCRHRTHSVTTTPLPRKPRGKSRHTSHNFALALKSHQLVRCQNNCHPSDHPTAERERRQAPSHTSHTCTLPQLYKKKKDSQSKNDVQRCHSAREITDILSTMWLGIPQASCSLRQHGLIHTKGFSRPRTTITTSLRAG